MNQRNHFRIRRPDLPMVLARLNLAAVAAALGTNNVAKGDLAADIEALVRLAKKQTFSSGRRSVIRPSPSTGEGKGED